MTTPSRIYHYSWHGQLLAERSPGGRRVSVSPDGLRLAWEENILGLTHAIVIGSTDFDSSLRLKGGRTCSLPDQGPYWLADSSGLVTSTTRGPRILHVDGTLEIPPASDPTRTWQLPVPAPDRPDLFVLGQTTVVDGNGMQLAAAVASPSRAISNGGIHPWGDRSDEVRIYQVFWGKGVGCQVSTFAPEVERAPFPEIVGLTVEVAANDCVNLRQAMSKDAAVISCMSAGTKLSAAQPPGRNNKGELSQWGNPMSDSMGGEWWWHVLTEQGQRGWVFLSDDYLSWSTLQPGEPMPDVLQQLIEDEIYNLRYWLGVAIGAEECGANCSGPIGLTEAVWGVMTWCQQGPGTLRGDPAFVSARHEAGLAALEQTCTGLQSAREILGQLNEGPAWKQKVEALRTGMPQ